MEHNEPKSGPEHATGSQDGAVIFMSDASAEADRLSAALRGRGYAVVDVPLGLLAGRAAVQRPAAVICDADAPGTLETLRRMQAAAGGRAIEVVLVGEEVSAPTRAQLEVESSGLFTRPVSADDLVAKIEQLIGPATARGSSPMGSGGRPAVLVAAARRPYRYEGHRLGARSPLSLAPPSGSPSQVPPPSSATSTQGRPSTLPPALTARSASVVPQPTGVVPHARLSPELEQLLGRAEQRVRQASLGTALVERLSPEAEVEAVLPAELLAALDEPLEVDDEDAEDSAAGTHGGGSESGAKGATRGTTSDGAGTAAGGRTAARREVTASGPGASIPETIAPPPEPPAPSEAEFPAEPPTAPPVRPSQSPPASLRTRTTLEPPSLVLESVRPTGPPASFHEIEPPSSVPQPHTVPPESPITTKPPRAEPAKAEPTRPEHPRAPTQPPTSAVSKQLAEPSVPDIPAVLGEGDGFRAIARAVAARFGGSIAFEDSAGIRRIVFRDGDFVAAASSSEGESLVAFLSERGDIAPDVAQKVARRVPPFGRHAGAALIAQGHLRQDELWPVLRSHAEWIIGRVTRMQRGAASLEFEVPQRLQAEPGVFGGATGAEVLLEIARRMVSPTEALLRLGGRSITLAPGATHGLLAECALSESETAIVKGSSGASAATLLDRVGSDDFASVLWALTELGVLSTELAPGPRRAPDASEEARHDPHDALALRERIAARRGLVEEGDYFALLGVGRAATSYDVRRAYLSARKSFDPARILTAETVDLREDLESILEVLDEAYEI
ncbi:MAG TPA: hypothetical protein VMS65_13655, partial [Polyangiaceae bacterium]|nr:hypothetical protein [Polyangiaceae bacterium]